MNKMKYTHFLGKMLSGLSMLLVFAAGCSVEGVETQNQEMGGMVDVCIAISDGHTRTELDPENPAITRWSVGDKIALWADNGSEWSLSATPFTLWHYSDEYSTAYFTAQIAMMADGNYDYFAAYPLPTSFSDGVANYTLPSVQDGSKSLANAVMVATPLRAGALTSGGDEELDFSFVHKLHILKITIPESKNLLGEPVVRLDITFPSEVVGDLAVDIRDASLPVTLSNGSNILSLNFSEPVDAGDVVYAVIAPTDASNGVITFKAYSELRESEEISTSGKIFEAAHTTPIRLTIPQLNKTTKIYFNVGDNHLGEEPQLVTFTLTDGTFPGGESSITMPYKGKGSYEYSYYGDYTDNVSGKSVTVSFDSANCLVSESFVMPQINQFAKNDTRQVVDVPYLLYEDFSGLNTAFEDGTNYTGSDVSEYSAIPLGTYGLVDWYGARVGGAVGSNLRIASRIETGLWATNRNTGRVDTPALNGIKAGKSIRIKVEYDYAGDRYEAVGSGGYPVYSSGCSDNVVTVGDDQIERLAVDSEVLQIDGPNANGTFYGNTPHHKSYTIDGCSNKSRVCWFLTNNRKGSFAGNGMYWLYIDNVKVTVAN